MASATRCLKALIAFDSFENSHSYTQILLLHQNSKLSRAWSSGLAAVGAKQTTTY